MLVYSSLERIFSGIWFTEAPQAPDKPDISELNVVFVYKDQDAKLVFHGKHFRYCRRPLPYSVFVLKYQNPGFTKSQTPPEETKLTELKPLKFICLHRPDAC